MFPLLAGLGGRVESLALLWQRGLLLLNFVLIINASDIIVCSFQLVLNMALAT